MQEVQQLKQKLQQLQQQYESSTKELEQQLMIIQLQVEQEKVAREQQLQKSREDKDNIRHTTATTAELAAQEMRKTMLGESNQVGAKFQGQVPSEPSYDLLKEADEKNR